MFNNRIKELRAASKLSQSAFAEKLSVSPSLIAHWESGYATPSLDLVIRVSEIFNVSVDYLIGNTPVPEPRFNIMSRRVSVFGRIPAGVPFDAIEDRLGDIPVPDWLARLDGLFGLLIVGESMNKILPDGVVGVFQKCETLESGQIGAVLVNGYDATVKRYFRLTDSILLEPQSWDAEFKPTIIKDGSEEVRVLGRLLWYSPLGQIK